MHVLHPTGCSKRDKLLCFFHFPSLERSKTADIPEEVGNAIGNPSCLFHQAAEIDDEQVVAALHAEVSNAKKRVGSHKPPAEQQKLCSNRN
jgi:hypothetical protein